MKLKSKYSFLQTVIVPLYIAISTIGLSLILFYAGLNSLAENDNGGIILMVSAFVFFLIGILGIVHYTKIVNQLTIEMTGIRIKGIFKNRFISWDEIEKIEITGKEYETFLFIGIPNEAISITTKYSVKEVFFIKLYSNMDTIRTTLDCINSKLVLNKKPSIECFKSIKRKKPVITDLNKLQKFAGNHFLSLNGIIFYVGILVSIWLFFIDGILVPKIAFSIFIFSLCYGLLGYQLHYFMINDQFLLVKNHVWFWKNDAFLIKDIKEVVFEVPNKMSTSIRVITNSYETKLYPAGSLRKKTWLRLVEKFKNEGVNTRVETYF